MERKQSVPGFDGAGGGAPVTASQAELALIPHKVENRIVQQRAHDGYINATEMCRASSKKFGHYNENRTTREFLAALSADIGIPISGLVQVVKGGPPDLQGTWVHPQVAIHLAQWLRPEFAVQVTKWVFEWMSGQLAREAMPEHVRRYAINQHKIPATDFSMLNQMIFRLLGPMELHGYTLPAGLMPDIALGKMFSGGCGSKAKIRTASRRTLMSSWMATLDQPSWHVSIRTGS